MPSIFGQLFAGSGEILRTFPRQFMALDKKTQKIQFGITVAEGSTKNTVTSILADWSSSETD